MYNKKAHIHFVGIGGIGMSGIATILKFQGYIISGCDLDLDQSNIKNLQELGCTIFHGNNTPGCHNENIDILVYSSALKDDNPEIIAAQKRGIPTIPRALMLAELMRTKYSIAIAGSHGKTTTTSLISHILIEAQMDPTVIIGGHLKTISTNARIGEGDFLVAEADESDRSLLHLHATLAVLTNIDLEHLETYKDLDDVKQTFSHFLNNLPFYGKAIICIDDKNVRSLLPMPHIKTITYGFDTAADMYATNIMLNPDHSTFTVYHTNKKLGIVYFAMPGRHNLLNALGAIALALELHVPFKVIAQALTTFQGVDRRFTYRGTYKGAEVFDDYGHHPIEIMNTLHVARNRSKNNVTVVFQPHRYTRTKELWNDFINIFIDSDIDHLIITDIYPASEQPIDGITSKKLVETIQTYNPDFKVSYIPYEDNFEQIQQIIDTYTKENDLLLLLGAGKLTKLSISLSKVQ